jgi:hypothetical protein
MVMDKKGAFDLSMSFIIVIVFAVVLLTLALTWIQGIFTDVQDMSDDMFKNSRGKIREMFTEGQDNFYIWPETYELQLSKSTKIAIAAGIKNDADDGENHKYVINAYATQVPKDANKNDVNAWLEFPETAKTVTINSDDSRMIAITIPSNAKKGNYFFEVAACFDMGGKEPKSGSCNGDSENLWGPAAQDFLLVIE